MLHAIAITPLLLALYSLSPAIAAPASVEHVFPPHPMITPPPSLVDRTPTPVDKRSLDLGSYVNGVLGSLGSDIPSYVASGVPNFFQNFPTGSGVESSLGISDSDLAATPTQVLNLP